MKFLPATRLSRASATSDAAPRAEPADPPRSRAAAITGAASGVERVAISGDSPRSSTQYPPAVAWPNPEPCFARP